MNETQRIVLEAIYRVEQEQLRRNNFDFWLTPAEIAASIPSELRLTDLQVRQALRALWTMRKVMQVCLGDSVHEQLVDVALDGLDAHGQEQTLKLEQNDVRGAPGAAYQQVAIYPIDADVRYRSRIAEMSRLLSYNYQRFNMAPATGLLRYERRPQRRPRYTRDIAQVMEQWSQDVNAGRIQVENDLGALEGYSLQSHVDCSCLARAMQAVMETLDRQLQGRGRDSVLAPFQVRSIAATLAGLYSNSYRKQYHAHVVTAGVGAGKSFAFQIGALIHVAYMALAGQRQVQVLLLYPRVVLAANQFQDLNELTAATAHRLGTEILPPCLDAGGQLIEQMGVNREQAGALLHAIQAGYQGNRQILISNLDTLANRLVHPEASVGLTRGLDLVVFDEIHLLRGVYGGHARMLLKRIELMRRLSRLRGDAPDVSFEQLLGQANTVPSPYFVAASATISEPRQHSARILSQTPSHILHIGPGEEDETGWVHHVFLKQKPEVSSTTAAINATACLIHNRRDGIFREYYERVDGAPISLEDLANPIQPSNEIRPRQPEHVHKTLGFCDSLDSIGSWADLVSDNENTKFASMPNGVNPATTGGIPYFVRFQEPLWRVVHHMSFRARPHVWQDRLRSHYGQLCRKCKQGIRESTSRFFPNASQRQIERIQSLWSLDPGDSYLAFLRIHPALFGASRLTPMHEARQAAHVENLEKCPFFRCGLCWWWSIDHLGSNRPAPPSHTQPLHGFKKPAQTNDGKYHSVNAIRLRTFTSNTEFSAMALTSINSVFRGNGSRIFRGRAFEGVEENAVFVIGSPRIEVGIDMSCVMDGITFRAMRDPASFQQKTGRVGRELQSDSLLIHVATASLREQYYFRNPRIILDPDYLQPIPLHERNAIIARNHYFMAILDFICQQGVGPSAGRIPEDGHRLNLVNDQTLDGFRRFADKVHGVYDFLFGNHSRQARNLSNLCEYLRLLGASDEEIEHPSGEVANLQPANGLTTHLMGAVDTFRHDFGLGFLQTPLLVQGSQTTLAQICGFPRNPFAADFPGLPRHEQFVRDYHEDPRTTVMTRSYLWQLLTMPVFRRGIPSRQIPGNQPWLWVPTLFESVGNESVLVFQEMELGRKDRGVETTALAIALLCPGTFTYRYYNDTGPLKVPVSSFGASGLAPLGPRIEAVRINVSDGEFYEPAGCRPLTPADMPRGFHAAGPQIPVLRPRQIGLIHAGSNPIPVLRGLIGDNDEANWPGPNDPRFSPLPTPPRSFPLRWYRAMPGAPQEIPCRFQQAFSAGPQSSQLPRLHLPPVVRLFSTVRFDPSLQVTDFVWGLDRTFTTRQVEPARLVYRDAQNVTGQAIAIGHHYRTPGLEFRLDFTPGSVLADFLQTVLQHPDSAVYQSLLWQVLSAFLSEHARSSPAPGAAPWVQGTCPSVFTVQDITKIVAFHLLETWHPSPGSCQLPAGRFLPTLPDMASCFVQGHANYIDNNRFCSLCQALAEAQDPYDVQARIRTLTNTWENFANASGQAGALDDKFFTATIRRILLNTLGLSLHAASLRLSGAEESDLSYFYKVHDDDTASIYLFDTDQFGNGTAQLIRDHFYISPIERTLNSRLAALGQNPDPLPTTDFCACFEEALQECDNSQAGHLAFHNMTANQEPFVTISAAVQGERRTAGLALDFVRQIMQLDSYDDMVAFQICPEFLAYLTSPTVNYPAYAGQQLIGSPEYPTFQSLESAMGMCLSGCLECVVAPEQNIHGPLAAVISVNKLLLDSLYRERVCQTGAPVCDAAYPGAGPARTTRWRELALTVAAATGTPIPGQLAMQVRLIQPMGDRPAVDIAVSPATTPGPWSRVFRVDWGPAGPPRPLVRPRMTL